MHTFIRHVSVLLSDIPLPACQPCMVCVFLAEKAVVLKPDKVIKPGGIFNKEQRGLYCIIKEPESNDQR